MNKIVVLLLALLCLVVAGWSCGREAEQTAKVVTGSQSIGTLSSAQQDLAVASAKELCLQKMAAGEDFSSGPCLSENLVEDYVADIVHSPRTKEDDKQENQCQNFIEGKASHFVELTEKCELIRVE